MALTDNLVLNWRLDAASGNETDVISSQVLTAVNSPTTATGKLYSTARVTASSGSRYFSIADNATISTGDINWAGAAWFYSTAFSGNRRLAYKGNSAFSILDWQLFHNAGTAWRFEVFSGSSQMGRAEITDATTNAWVFLCWSHDATNNRIRLRLNNGTANDVATTGSPADTSQALTIGSAAGVAGTFFDGRIGQFLMRKGSIWTTTEEGQLYNGGAGIDPNTGGSLLPLLRHHRAMQGAA